MLKGEKNRYDLVMDRLHRTVVDYDARGPYKKIDVDDVGFILRVMGQRREEVKHAAEASEVSQGPNRE